MSDFGRSGFSDYSLVPFFEQTEDLLCIAGFDGYFKKVNPALTNLLGYSKEELFSKPINSFIHPDDQELTAQHRENIQQGKSLLNFENRYLTKSRDTVWFTWTSIPVYEQKVVYAIAKNITQRKKHEAERNRILTRLTRTNKQLKQLNYTTSHDMRSPISSILTIFDLLNISDIKDAETRELIELLKISTINLKKTIDSNIDQLKDDDTLQIQVIDLNIQESLNSVSRSLDTLIQDSNTSFEIDLGGFETVKFNLDYLQSIFLNLISNSIKYAHPKRDPVITIKTVIEDGSKRLLFSDNGQGFDSEAQHGKVFGLYQKFHDHTDSKGIGLYLVYNHITSLGGSITVDSKVNEGTTFMLTF